MDENKLAGVAIDRDCKCLAKEGNIAHTPTSPEVPYQPVEEVGSSVLPALYTGQGDAVHRWITHSARAGNESGFQ